MAAQPFVAEYFARSNLTSEQFDVGKGIVMAKEYFVYRVARGASFVAGLLAATRTANAQSVVSGVSVVAPPQLVSIYADFTKLS